MLALPRNLLTLSFRHRSSVQSAALRTLAEQGNQKHHVPAALADFEETAATDAGAAQDSPTGAAESKESKSREPKADAAAHEAPDAFDETAAVPEQPPAPRPIATQRGSTTTMLKCVVLGSSNVGKSSLLERYTKNSFRPERRVTLGADFASKVIDGVGARPACDLGYGGAGAVPPRHDRRRILSWCGWCLAGLRHHGLLDLRPSGIMATRAPAARRRAGGVSDRVRGQQDGPALSDARSG